MACRLFVAKLLSEPILDYCQLDPEEQTNKLQWNFNQYTKLFIPENASENIVCEKAAILSRGRWVHPSSTGPVYIQTLNLLITVATDVQTPLGWRHSAYYKFVMRFLCHWFRITVCRVDDVIPNGTSKVNNGSYTLHLFRTIHSPITQVKYNRRPLEDTERNLKVINILKFAIWYLRHYNVMLWMLFQHNLS